MIPNKKIKIGIFLLIFILVLSSYVYAVVSPAVSSFYWRENPLNLTIGETKDIEFTLQNNIGEENMTVMVNIIKGSEIIKLLDESNIYFVPYRSDRPKVNVRVSIPENAKIGDVYGAELEFATVKEGSEGGLGFGASISRSFGVNVVEKPKPPEEVVLPEKKPPSQTIYLVIIVVVIAAIIIVTIVLFNLLKKKKQNNLTRKKDTLSLYKAI